MAAKRVVNLIALVLPPLATVVLASSLYESSGAPEAEIIQRFYDGIEKYTPDLVSWNGGGFDLPVLHYRALRHGIIAPR